MANYKNLGPHSTILFKQIMGILPIGPAFRHAGGGYGSQPYPYKLMQLNPAETSELIGIGRVRERAFRNG